MLKSYLFILSGINIFVILANVSIFVLGLSFGRIIAFIDFSGGPIILLFLLPMVFNVASVILVWILSIDNKIKITLISLLIILHVLQFLFFGYLLYENSLDYFQ